MVLNVAFNYGARHEIARAVRRMVADGVAAEDVTEELIDQYLDTAGLPDVDLVIRTAGEMRLSNFLLWQAAYAEYYSTPVCWPEFRARRAVRGVSRVRPARSSLRRPQLTSSPTAHGERNAPDRVTRSLALRVASGVVAIPLLIGTALIGGVDPVGWVIYCGRHPTGVCARRVGAALDASPGWLRADRPGPDRAHARPSAGCGAAWGWIKRGLGGDARRDAADHAGRARWAGRPGVARRRRARHGGLGPVARARPLCRRADAVLPAPATSRRRWALGSVAAGAELGVR